jgi:cell division transport system permease protein
MKSAVGNSRRPGRAWGALHLVPAFFAARHLQACVSTLGQLVRAPLGTLMTVAVVGIALALPTGLYVLLDNVSAVSQGWDGNAEISLFLRADLGDRDAEVIAGELGKRPEIQNVRVIGKAQALEEYRRLSGFEDVLSAFDRENPLPAVLVLEPRPDHADAPAVRRLLDELGKRSEVEAAQFDLQWLRRLHAIMDAVRRGVVVLATLLALGVLLIVGNTIRLSIQNRREEIEIAKLFGATDGFIRRPFLYTGLWYGVFGAIAAWLMVHFSLGLLHGPVRELASLYYSDFAVQAPSLATVAVLLTAGAGLGLVGSWLAVGRHLNAIEPS